MTRPVAIFLAIASIACGAEPPAPVTPPAATPAAGHTHAAPHGGVLVELGEEFGHVELVLDGTAGALTAYVLDGEAEQSVRLAQTSIGIRLNGVISNEHGGGDQTWPVELAARANVLTGETVGDTSQFALTDPVLKGVKTFRGVIVHITYKGQDFRDVPVTYPAK
jgi:hypothetical protein